MEMGVPMSRVRGILLRALHAWHTAESGQGLAEYALILAFIAIVCVGAVGTLGATIRDSSAWTLP